MIPREFKLMPVRECPYFEGSPVQDLPQAILGYWKMYVEGRAEFDARLEVGVVFFFDAERRLMGHTVLERGGQTWASLDGVQVLWMARQLGASGVAVAHNHPDGDPNPSAMDQMAATTLVRQARFHEVELLDFLVVGCWSIVSFAANGLLDESETERTQPCDQDLAVADRWMLASHLLGNQRALVDAATDAAGKAGLSTDEFVFGLAREFIRAHLRGGLGADPKLVFAAHVAQGADAPALLAALNVRAADAGEPFANVAWKLGVEEARRNLLAAGRSELAVDG